MLLSVFSTPSLAQSDDIIVGRFLTVKSNALSSQADLLQQMFQVRFPSEVKTVGSAIHYLLKFSGYALVANNALPITAQSLLQQPLPEVDRSLGPMSLKEGLMALVGEPFGLLVDPVHRLIQAATTLQFSKVHPR